MPGKPPQAAAIYARISHDPSGERLGVQRQEADCRAEAARRGWRVAQVYEDDDRSAFSTRKPRPEYQRLLRDLNDGVVDGVLIWRLDRLHRQPRELEEFIVICDKHQVALATVTGDVDLSTTQGRLLARAWGAFAAHESEVRSERLKRFFLERARKGTDAWTNRMYGYQPDLRTINRREAAVIRELTRKVLRGESLRSLVVDLNRRRVRSTAGAQWTASQLSCLLRNPRLAGLSQYRGEIVGKGVWPAIIRPADSARLRELFGNRDKQYSVADSPNLLTGLLICGGCGHKMTPTYTSPFAERRRYACPNVPVRGGCGRVSVKASFVEPLAFQAILARLAGPEVMAKPVRASVRDRRWLKAAAELDRAQHLLDSAAKDLGDGRISRREWLLMRPLLAGRMEHAKAIVMQDRYDTSLSEFIGKAERLEQGWGEMAPSRQRTVMRGLIHQLVVRPAALGQVRFNPERVIIRWRGDGPFPRHRRLAAPPREHCGVRGCKRADMGGRGFCHMHYARWRITGHAGSASPLATNWFIGKPCKANGCEVESTKPGWCPTHYNQWLAETATEPRCQIPGCERPTLVRGLCLRHYERQAYQAARALQLAKEAIDPSLRKTKPCKEPTCVERASQLGLCVQHYDRWLRRTADLPRCTWEGCERPRQIRGMCSKHESRTRYYERAAIP